MNQPHSTDISLKLAMGGAWDEGYKRYKIHMRVKMPLLVKVLKTNKTAPESTNWSLEGKIKYCRELYFETRVLTSHHKPTGHHRMLVQYEMDCPLSL